MRWTEPVVIMIRGNFVFRPKTGADEGHRRWCRCRLNLKVKRVWLVSIGYCSIILPYFYLSDCCARFVWKLQRRMLTRCRLDNYTLSLIIVTIILFSFVNHQPHRWSLFISFYHLVVQMPSKVNIFGKSLSSSARWYFLCVCASNSLILINVLKSQKYDIFICLALQHAVIISLLHSWLYEMKCVCYRSPGLIFVIKNMCKKLLADNRLCHKSNF